MNTEPEETGEEAEKPPLPEDREDLLALVREVRGTIAATVLEVGDDEQIVNFVESLQRSNLLPEPPPEEDGEEGEEGEAPAEGEAEDAKPAEAKPAEAKPADAKSDAAKPAADEKPGPDANPGSGKSKADAKAAEEGGSERRSQVLSYVAKSLQEAAKLLRDAPQDQVELFAKRLRMIVNDLKANLDKPD